MKYEIIILNLFKNGYLTTKDVVNNNIPRTYLTKLVKEGKIPQGKKQQGFKELSWTKKELDKYTK